MSRHSSPSTSLLIIMSSLLTIASMVILLLAREVRSKTKTVIVKPPSASDIAKDQLEHLVSSIKIDHTRITKNQEPNKEEKSNAKFIRIMQRDYPLTPQGPKTPSMATVMTQLSLLEKAGIDPRQVVEKIMIEIHHNSFPFDPDYCILSELPAYHELVITFKKTEDSQDDDYTLEETEDILHHLFEVQEIVNANDMPHQITTEVALNINTWKGLRLRAY